MSTDELHRLIDELLEQTISEADFLRLEAELIVEPAARRAYFDRVGLTMALETEARAIASSHSSARIPLFTPNVKAEEFGQGNFFARHGGGMAMAAAFVVLLGLAALWFRPGPPSESSAVAVAEESKASGFAVLANQVGAVWESRALRDGELLPQGVMKLQAGIAQIELFSGVTLVIEGAAEFELLSPMELRLAGGKLRAQVPEPAHGFRVRTAGGDVVDLGTEFALNVAGQQSEVHVLDGAVEWHPQGQQMRRMQKGQALRAKSGAADESIAADADAFAGLARVRALNAAARESRHAKWRQRVEELQRDSRLLAFYSLATPEGVRHLPNLAAGETRPGAGAVVAAAGTEDRWGGVNGALDFSPTGSRVRLNVPGAHRSLTMLCWVKLNSLDRLYNSLFLTDGHEVGAPHWQITRDGRLFFSIKKFDRLETNKYNCFSTPFWSPALAGQWLMLAVVYDAERGQVAHYLNGESIAIETVPADYVVTEVRMGNASIGNWSEPVYRTDAEFAVRNLNGSMDEFAMFDAALSAGEIKSLHQDGKP